MESIKKHIDLINNLCRDHHVSELYILNPKDRKKKDLIMLVRFGQIPPEAYAENYFAFKFALKDLLIKDIILLEEQALKNPFFKKHIEYGKQLIYGQQDKGLAV